MKKESSNKRIITLGRLNTHQWGTVNCGGGISPTITATEYKRPAKVVKKWRRNP